MTTRHASPGRRPNPQRRYHLLTEVAEDALGTVWQAGDSWMPVLPVTIRVLHRRLVSRLPIDEFRRDLIATASRLSHPSVARIINVPESAEGEAFVVMEGLPGRTLADLLASGHQFAPEEIARIGSQIASALEAAHEQGVVHGALTPSSVVVDALGDVKVMDFGLVAQAVRAQQEFTDRSEGSAIADGDLEPDPAGDVRALGSLLSRMLASRRQSDRDLPVGRPSEAGQERLSRPSAQEGRVVEILAGTCRQALADAPAERPSAGQIASALEAAWESAKRLGAEARSERRLEAVPVDDTGHAPEPVRRGSQAGRATSWAAGPRRLRPAWAAIGVLIAVFLGFALIALPLGDEATSPDGVPGSDSASRVPTAPGSVAPDPTEPGSLVRVPRLVGLTSIQAMGALSDAGLRVDRVRPAAGTPGRVVRSDPAAGSMVPANSSIVLFVGAPPDRIDDDGSGTP